MHGLGHTRLGILTLWGTWERPEPWAAPGGQIWGVVVLKLRGSSKASSRVEGPLHQLWGDMGRYGETWRDMALSTSCGLLVLGVGEVREQALCVGVRLRAEGRWWTRGEGGG